LIAIIAMSVNARKAHAFDDSTQFFNQALAPHAATYGASSEGIYFTGAPRFLSMVCDKCHTDGPGVVRLKLGADDPSLFDGGYRPGQTYELEVALQGETEGLDHSGATCTEPPLASEKYTYVPCNNNNFALEIDTGSGPLAGPMTYCTQAPAGGACPPAGIDDETVLSPDNDAVFGNRTHQAANPRVVAPNDPTTWHLWWSAPAAGSGPVTIYVAAVDGNGGDGTAASDQDTIGDDTVQASFFIQEAGASVPVGATAGCSAASGHASIESLRLALLLSAILIGAARRRRQ
jgi:hypothetical protein